MIDMVPKSISLTLVQHSKDLIQKELLQELYKPDVLEDIMKESPVVIERRAEVVKMLGALNKAEEYATIPHFSYSTKFNRATSICYFFRIVANV